MATQRPLPLATGLCPRRWCKFLTPADMTEYKPHLHSRGLVPGKPPVSIMTGGATFAYLNQQ